MSIVTYFDLATDAPSAVAQVTARLAEAIITGAVVGGSKISEPGLARRLEVSRSTVREAIARLEAAHLVTRKPNVGARVVRLSAAGLLELYQVRESLEGLACRLAAENINAAELATLDSLVDRTIVHSGHFRLITRAQHRNGDMDFHYQLIHCSRNAQLQKLLCRELYPQISMYRYQFAIASPRLEVGLKEHRFIVDAIRDRDAEMAEMLMRRHIRASRLNIESQLSMQSGDKIA